MFRKIILLCSSALIFCLVAGVRPIQNQPYALESVQIVIEYSSPINSTQKFTVSIDERVNTGNAFVDSELSDYLQFCKKLINDSNKPKFYVTETSEKIYILAVWPEFYEDLEYDESDFNKSQTIYQYLHCNLAFSSV